MNAVLSLFLSLAMLFSGGALPAEVETVSVLTVQDVVLNYEDNNYPLGFDLSLSAGTAQDELLLHFELSNDDETLMPVSGRITRDGVTFALNDEGNAFTVSADKLNRMLELESDDLFAIENMCGGMESYVKALTLIYSDPSVSSPEADAAAMEIFYSNMQNVVREKMEWDFGSGEIPAEHVYGTFGASDLFAALDGWRTMDNEAVSAAFDGLLDFYNGLICMSGYMPESAGEDAAYVPAESFTEMIAYLAEGEPEVMAELEQISAEMDIITSTEGDAEYQVVNLYMVLNEETGAAMNVSAEAAVTSEESTVYTALYMEEENYSTSYEMQLTVDGPMENPASMNMETMMQTDISVDFTDYEAEDYEEDILYNTNSSYVSAGIVFEDGAQDVNYYAENTNSSMRYTGGEYVEEDEPIVHAVNFYMDAEKDDEGRPISDIELEFIEDDEMVYGISCSTVLSQIPAVDYFAELTPVELTGEDEDPAYEAIEQDSEALMQDAEVVAADEDFAALVQALFFYEPEVYDDKEYDEEDYEDEEDYDDEEYYEDEDEEYDDDDVYYEDYEFSTLEEAAEVFAGELISFTAPEGFELEEVYVSGDGYYVNANYYAEDDRYISFNQDYYDEDTGYADYFSVADGAVTQIDDRIATLYKSETGYYYAQFYMPDGSLAIYFDDCDVEGVKTILGGISF